MGLARPGEGDGAEGVGLRPQQQPLHGGDLPADCGPYVPGGSRGSTIHGSGGTCDSGTRAAHARGHCPKSHGLVRTGTAGEGLGGEDQTHQTQVGPARKRPADEAPVQTLRWRRDRIHPHEVPGKRTPGTRRKTAKKTTVDGWDREDEVEERGEPKTRHQLERMHAVFRNTLLMCVLSFPQFGQFDITREDLESWYEWFYGEDIGGRFPPPEDHVLAIAERNAWRKIHEQMHEGSTLKAAMLSVRQDTLFWTREVYEKIRTFSRGRPQTRSSMDYAPPQKGKNKSKGKGKSRGKPGSKGKGKPPQPNNQASRGSNKQAATDPKGNQFCNNWMRGRCPGNCGRTHKCNLILATGRICLGDHLPQDCPG